MKKLWGSSKRSLVQSEMRSISSWSQFLTKVIIIYRKWRTSLCMHSLVYNIYSYSHYPESGDFYSRVNLNLLGFTDLYAWPPPVEKNHNTVAVGGHPHPAHCSGVPVSKCPSVLVSQCFGVPVSRCPSVPVSQCPNVLVSWCPSVPMSQCLGVPLFWCPSVLVSQCPSIRVS